MASTVTELLRRRFGGKKGEDLSTWVKVTFHLNNDSASQYIVDGSTSRVPDAAFIASRIIVDGTEITPVRYMAMSRGDHTVYYQIGNGMNAGWWYWVTNVRSIEIPANVTSLNGAAIAFATSPAVVMTFYGHAPFPSTYTFPTYVRDRTIYVKEEYKQEYIDLGFTNVNTF